MGNKITRRCSTVDERYTRPQGLYPQRDVDQKKLRRLILDSKLAPCFPGEEELSADFEECPICFLCYPSLNRSKCCSQGVCTECFLQIKSPRATRSTQCPFCKSHNYAVEYRGSKTLEEKGIEAAEEQKFIEAKIRMRKQELLEDEEREQRKEEEGRAATPPAPVIDVEAADHDLSCGVAESRFSELGQEDLSSVASVMSNDRRSSCDSLELSRVCEEHGSEGSLEPSPVPQQSTAPSPPTPSAIIESATPQQQPGSAPPGYTRHRDDEFDFDLEDIMVMEAIWQSIQDQGARHRCTALEPPRMQAPNELADLSTEFQEDGGHVGGEALTSRMAGGLASAIAAMAERDAISKRESATLGTNPTSNTATTSFEDSARCDNKPEGVAPSGESDLHAMAVTLATPESGSESVFVNSSSSKADDGCCSDDYQGEDDGASSSSAPNDDDAPVCVTPVAAMILPRCAPTDADGKVMLPKSFEEHMMLAMALSLADAQSRARLEDSHPRPLNQPIFD